MSSFYKKNTYANSDSMGKPVYMLRPVVILGSTVVSTISTTTACVCCTCLFIATCIVSTPLVAFASTSGGSTEIRLEVGVHTGNDGSNPNAIAPGGLSGHGSTAGVYYPNNTTTPQASSTNASSSLSTTLDVNGKPLLPLPKTEFVDDFVVRARTASSDILLTWDNSTFARGSYVRIVRSPFFYPLDQLDGKVVYEGKGASARDTDMMQDQNQNQTQKYFYSIFLLNQKRAVISSAIATVTYQFPSLNDPLIQGDNTPFVVPDTALEDESLCVGEKGYVDLAEYTSSFKKSELSKLEISQGKTQNTLLRGSYTIVKNQPVYIRIPSDAIHSLIAGDTTRVALCLVGDTPDVKKGYLFSYNTEGKFYEVTLPPFLRIKDYQFYVGMLKYKGVESILTAHKFAVVDKLGGTGGDVQRIQDDRVNTLPFLQRIRDRGYLYWSTFKASAYEVVQKFLSIFGW